MATTQYLIIQSPGLTQTALLDDNTRKRALVRSLEIMVEAAKQIPHAIRQKSSRIPWRAITGMRHRLMHADLGVDYEIVWECGDR